MGSTLRGGQTKHGRTRQHPSQARMRTGDSDVPWESQSWCVSLTYRCLCTTSSFGAFLVAISLAQGIYFTF